MSSELVFNGPFKRAELLLLPQYAASVIFTASGRWTGTKNHILSFNDGDVGNSTEPLYCIVVGIISEDNKYLGLHGNFSSKFGDDARKAKLQFTLTRPNDADFGPDFDKAVAAFEDHQNTISGTTRQRYFLQKERTTSMRLNYTLFEPKGDSNDKDRERETQAYQVGPDYETYWDAAKATNFCCIMPVFDTNDAPILPSRFAGKLVGAMCEVTFTLRHYAIGGKEPNDVFSAHVESMAILRKPPVLVPSPYKGRLTRRPHHKPQLPTRGEQVNATLAFVPRPDHPPPFAVSDESTSPPVASGGTTVSSVSIETAPAVEVIRTPRPQLADVNKKTDTVVAPDRALTIPAIRVPANSTHDKTVTGKIRTRSSAASIGTDDGNNADQTEKKRRIGN